MTSVRLGAVSYLNTRPLIDGLERSARFDLRLDVPARCAALLHEGSIDLGLIPSIEYLRGPDEAGRHGDAYRIVPGISLASHGAVASVALFTGKPVETVRSIALDTDSRTSVALLTVLCAKHFKIAPATEARTVNVHDVLGGCDAALVIGDNALFLDHESIGLTKIDLGEAWLALTGLPFVYAVWAGRPGALRESHIEELQGARDRGVAHHRDIAARCYPTDVRRRHIAEAYLRDNMKYGLDEASEAGLRLFFRYAADLGIVAAAGDLRFYP